LLIDLHCHTRVYSACSALTPEALARAALAAGLDGVCVTEHDALWPLDDIETLSREFGLVVLRGVEVTTDMGHVLAFGLTRYAPEMARIERLKAIADGEGAVLVLAHPSRRYGALPEADPALWFHAFETENGTEGRIQNETAARVSRALPLPGTGGSDAHAVREVGTAATLFERAVSREQEFLDELRAGRYRAVDRRDAAASWMKR
jgi:predicted metal-dependent phosphoesterase TrpH